MKLFKNFTEWLDRTNSVIELVTKNFEGLNERLEKIEDKMPKEKIYSLDGSHTLAYIDMQGSADVMHAIDGEMTLDYFTKQYINILGKDIVHFHLITKEMTISQEYALKPKAKFIEEHGKLFLFEEVKEETK